MGRKVTVRSSHRNMEDVHLRPMPCGVRHPGPFDRRDPGPDFRQSHRTGQQRVHLSRGGARPGAPLPPRPDPPAHAAQRKKGRILLGAHLLGRSSRPHIPGASGVVEGKTGRSFRGFRRRPEHAAHALCRGFCDPHGLYQLFPLADSGHQRTRFLAGVRGIPPPCLRPGKNRLPSHVRDKNFDEEFIARHTRDFVGGQEDFPNLVSRYSPPDKVSAITGVPPETLLRLAREFSSAKAPLALSGGVSDRSETALFTQWAVASLNVLSGSFSAKGLWREPVPLPWGTSPVPSATTRSGAFSLHPQLAPESDLPAHWASEELPHLRSAGKLPDLNMLMIAQVDPLYQPTDQKLWQEWLSRGPQAGQFAPLMDDTSPYADLILPTTTYLDQGG